MQLFCIVLACSVLAGLLGGASVAQASPPPDTDADMQVRGQSPDARLARDRSVTTTTRKDLDAQQPRSTPDALRFTEGVYVQQTGHGQASPYIRGRTGQSTLLMFDGLRINHALFRQGPNQYLFTVDAQTIDHIDVVRGSASVELGADALSGAVLITPLDPAIDPTLDGFTARGRVRVQHATQDRMFGGRGELDLQLGPQTGLLVGLGGRTVDRLESGGPIGHLLGDHETDLPLFEKQVPTFTADGRTMLGTGFDEWTADARLVHRLTGDDHITAAAYLYRQSDAPRTDQCPPPEANLSECLIYDHQDRTQIYSRAALSPHWAALDRLDISAGFQRQSEQRTLDRSETLGSRSGGSDAIDIWSLRAAGSITPLALSDRWRARLAYGIDGSFETVASSAYIELVRIDVRRPRDRGQYVDGSRFAQGGLYLAPRLEWSDWLSLRTGLRVAGAQAKVPTDADSDTRGVNTTWSTVIGNIGLEVVPHPALTLIANVEQGFRPPNLDDLSARQPTGRGFQLENPALTPEAATTYEAGIKAGRGRFTAEIWGFYSQIDDLLERRIADCPPAERECRAARVAVQLVNLTGISEIIGTEASLRMRPIHGVSARAGVAWTRGRSDSPVANRPGRIAISRIPPVNGTAEVKWSGRDGLYLGGALRWALAQRDLSVADEADARIPFGGTPGYAVLDARLGVQHRRFSFALVLENLVDAPYRVHGSAINGPGRGATLSAQARF
ncbi:MAG: outer membrane receptor protein involved in Fe transport [Bradymonadia bacterium]|jgi:outer membrane receptor protein involved in Fe transport